MALQHDLGAIAHRMKTAQDEARQIEPLTSCMAEFDLGSAYAVMHLIHEARVRQGAIAVGRKIGFTNPDMWARYGVREPIWAYVYNTTVRRVGDGRCGCRIGRFCEPKIEPEIVFHFRSAPPAGGDLLAVLGCVDWIAHGFEIVQSHFPGWKFQAADTVADWALHATLLVGSPQAVVHPGMDLIAALESFSVELSCNGELRERGYGSNVLGNPLAAINHLIAVLANQPQSMPLQADEIVTTGTVTTAHTIHAGETWRTDLRGIALTGLSVQFVE